MTLRQGEALAMLQDVPDSSIDCVITDPPYSSGGQFRGDRMQRPTVKYQNSDAMVVYPEFAGDNRDQRSYGYWCALWLSECLRVARPAAPICLFTDWRQLPITTDSLQAGGWVWRGIAVWDKTEGSRPQKGRFRAQAEYVVWGSKGEMPITEEGLVLPGVFRYCVRSDDKFHVTGKPTGLMQDIVRICPAGGTILDPFAGSGTTGVAAVLSGYQFLGFESDPECFAVAERRIQAARTSVVLRRETDLQPMLGFSTEGQPA